ncbi:unnamed protein product [Dicrocoelium dendriticum]|nr:unnamed protein product [Dicrocoelium dendriticum]
MSIRQFEGLYLPNSLTLHLPLEVPIDPSPLAHDFVVGASHSAINVLKPLGMPVAGKVAGLSHKAIPRNPKYEDVTPIVDTGASMSRYLKRIEELRENFRIRDDEIFKRLKLSTFVQLILQVHETTKQNINIQTFDAALGDCANGGPNAGRPEETQIVGAKPPHDSQISFPSRSTLENLIHGVGELDSYYSQQATEEVASARKVNEANLSGSAPPYLLLDLRDRDEFDSCHIITAHSYPAAMLSRSINYETAAMLAFRNQPGRIIVLYDEDERIAPRAATTLVQRGYSNLYLLSGGLKLAWKQFPEGLLIGEMPASVRQALGSRRRERPGGCNALIRENSTSVSSESCAPGSCQSSSSVRSKNTTASVYCPVGSRDTTNGLEQFLPEDIVKLTMQLENGMDDGRSIRSGYTRSTISSLRHSNRAIPNAKKPFR